MKRYNNCAYCSGECALAALMLTEAENVKEGVTEDADAANQEEMV